MRDPRLFYIHSRWADEAAFQKHRVLPHTERFLKKVDALLDQPREVTRTEMIARCSAGLTTLNTATMH